MKYQEKDLTSQRPFEYKIHNRDYYDKDKLSHV